MSVYQELKPKMNLIGSHTHFPLMSRQAIRLVAAMPKIARTLQSRWNLFNPAPLPK